MLCGVVAARIWPVVASLGRLEQQQGVGASSLEMLTGASGGTILGAGTGGVVGLSALPSEYLRCFSCLTVSGFC